MNLNQASYNKIAKQWAASRDNSFLSELVIMFASSLEYRGKVLDIGCGTGFPIASYLSDQGFEVTGIDFSEKLLQKARERKISNSKFHLCDFFDFEPEDIYDGIIAFDSFFHFPKDKQTLIYQKVSVWMSKGAYLLFTHGNTDGEIEGKMFDETFYYSSLHKDEVGQLLHNAGFEIVWAKEKYIERDTDRDFVVLARKTK